MNPALLTLPALVTPFVTHGTDDAGDPAVVAIVDKTGTTGCTGTVIAPHFVLTAAHCIVPELRTGAHAVFGASVASPTAAVPIEASFLDPAFDPQTYDHDAAVLVLGAVSPAAAVPLATSAPAAASTIRVVGFGFTAADAGDAGTKREGTALITVVGPSTLSVAPDASQPCLGVSGGPALVTLGGRQVVAGVTSHGDAACVQSAVYTRVDVEVSSFIAPTLAAHGDGTVAAGGRCLYPEQCRAGAAACVTAPDDANVRYCTQSCGGGAGCPGGMQCVTVGSSGSQCRYPVPTPGAMGAACSADADCVDASCLRNVCTQACSALDPTCPTGFSCASSDGVDYACTLSPAAPTNASSCAMSPASDDGRWTAPALAVLLWASRRRRAGPERP